MTTCEELERVRRPVVAVGEEDEAPESTARRRKEVMVMGEEAVPWREEACCGGSGSLESKA